MTKKRVYAVPVEFTIRAALFVLADSPDHANDEAALIDLASVYSFDDNSFWLEEEDRSKLLDVTNERFLEGEAPQAVPLDEFDPSDHPDYEEN